MSGTASQVWISAADGGDMVRADAIVMLRLDETGRLTAQLRDDARVSVSLLEGSSAGGRPPADFHRQLIRAVVELADSSGARLVHARHEDGVWRWISESL
ncbi:hypothetical protein [Actinomadura macra]|uniref:hypothetical protein n=1 Tax=Actinomadura macra TaxID=46164 RepID=UPI00082B64ED|nr:hypothetical protein [Actinomadura macra]